MRSIPILVCCLFAVLPARGAEPFRSAWPADADRVWAGPEYWTNRLQDWRVSSGRLECTTSGGDRNCHLLTRELAPGAGTLSMSVRLGRLDEKKPTAGWAGFRVGSIGVFRDYRDSCRRGVGLDCGVTTDGALFIGKPKGGAGALPHRGISRKGWKIHFVTNEEKQGGHVASQALDGNPGTYWHSQYVKTRGDYPYEFQVDLGASHDVSGFCVLPRQVEETGRIKDYAFYVSSDGKAWGEPVAEGSWPNSPKLQTVRCKPTTGRYVRLLAKSGVLAGRPACVIAELYVLDPKTANARPTAAPAETPADALPLDDVRLRVDVQPKDDGCQLTLAALDPKTGKELASASRAVPADSLVGNVALVCHAATGGRGGQNAGGNVRFWFRDWTVEGSRVTEHDDHAFGPILWAQHTLSRGVLKMTAQMPPIGKNDAQTVRLEVQKSGKWAQVATAPIDAFARTATFRVPDWNDKADVPYRVVYAFQGSDHTWAGTVRKDPVDKDTIVVAAFTGNADYLFPNNTLVRDIQAQNPDLLFFSGDNIYENVGGYGTQRAPLDEAVLDYLRKWYFFGWAYADLLRDRPTISVPDDHDVYQGNLWGQGGRKCPGGINTGGYAMPAEWVKTVERTQTSNLPDPYDPTPVEQGIGVYYCDLLYGRVSFAVIEDRKFKTGPEGVVPKTKGRSDHVNDPNFDPKTADVPEARLLGDRQLKFLRAWAADWRGADFKVALSQTVFANAATLHGGGLTRLVADYDSNGWPQTGRNKALDALRRGFAFMIGGDQHLATLIHHGIDAWNDAGWSLCVPSVVNFYPRAWVPLKPAHDWKKGMIPHTGQHLDGFGNHITVYAHCNPRPMNQPDVPGEIPPGFHDKMPGYGIARFHKDTRKIDIECWPLFADPKDPKTGGQYEGWPRTIDQTDNYGREAVAWLPTLKVSGMENPVVQVIDEADGNIVYTLRIRGTTFRPKVFKAGTYTITVGEPGTKAMKTLKGVRSDGGDGELEVRLKPTGSPL